MTKKKKKKDEWTNFIFRLFTRKRANRKFTIPTTYLLALADKIHQINPTREIVFNTIRDVYLIAHERGYARRLSDEKFFKEKQAKCLKESWNTEKDRIDDMIHIRNINQ